MYNGYHADSVLVGKMMFKRLLDAGANPSGYQDNGDNMVEFLAGMPIEIAQEEIQLLHDHGLSINVLDAHGRSALMGAARSANQPVSDFLIGKGAKLDLQDESGWTALMYAASEATYAGDYAVKVVQSLIAAHADLNLKTKDGRTALDCAWNGAGAYSVLQEAGAKPWN